MKRIFGLLFIMFAIYLIIQLGYNFFSKGYEIEYKIDDHTVYERYIANTKGEIDSYYIEVKDGNDVFTLNTYKDFNKRKELVKHITILKGTTYKCAYIELKDNYLSNILCLNRGIYYNYQDIAGKDKTLDNKVKDLKYNLAKFVDLTTIAKSDEVVSVVAANLVKNQYIGLANYKGIYLINNYTDGKYLYETAVFEQGKSNHPISTYISHYYLVADYDGPNGFDKFYLVDITFGDKKTITYHSKISFNSYIMGKVENKVYLLDCSSGKQYEIDIKTRTIIEVGNKTLGIKYYKNGEWSIIKQTDAVNSRPKFIIDEESSSDYKKITIVGGEKTGYKYYYKFNGLKYDVYRSMQNDDKKLYIFSTDNIDNIVYYRDYVYFQDGDYIKYYQDNKGVQKICHINSSIYDGILNFGVSNG